MDYPDSEEETTHGGEAVINPNILDIEDTEMADAEAPKLVAAPAATMTPAHISSKATAAGRQPASGDHFNNKEKLSDGACGTKKRQTSALSGGSPYDGPDLPPIYLTVRKEREKRLVARNLYGCGYTGAECTTIGASVSQIETVGSFSNAGDKRHNHTQLKHDFKNLRNLSTSFDTNTLNCISCPGGHSVLRREIGGEDVGMDFPPVFILTDQNFSPMVPAGAEGECLKIIQIEHGNLAELASVFLEITKGFAIPAGTVLVLASASHMAAVGKAEYSADFVKASIRLREAPVGSGYCMVSPS